MSERSGDSVNRHASLAASHFWRRWSRDADHARLEHFNPSSVIHLPLEVLELGDLAFGLTVGPAKVERCSNRRFILHDTGGKGGSPPAYGSSRHRLAVRQLRGGGGW